MKLAFVLTAFTVGLLHGPARAQSDNAQILELLQKMDKRFDTIDERLDALEGKPGEVAPGTAPPSSAAPPGKAVPGWRVTIAPFDKKGKPADPIGRVIVPIGETKFDQHFSKGQVTNSVEYAGSAFFWAKVPGKYTFNIGVEPRRGSRFGCYTALSVEDQELVTADDHIDDKPITKSGGVELQEGKYQVTYRVGCWNELSEPWDPILTSSIDKYKQTSYRVTVLGPDDEALRDFTPDELFVLRK